MNGNTVDALKGLFAAVGGDATSFVANTIPDAIAQIAGHLSIKDINVQPCKGSSKIFDVPVSSLQTGVVVADGAITGTIKYLTDGGAITDYWGPGNFLALKFVDPNTNTDHIDVRLNPSAGSGWVTLDADMDGVFKISSTEQKFEVKTVSTDGAEKIQQYDLSGLELQSE